MKLDEPYSTHTVGTDLKRKQYDDTHFASKFINENKGIIIRI